MIVTIGENRIIFAPSYKWKLFHGDRWEFMLNALAGYTKTRIWHFETLGM